MRKSAGHFVASFTHRISAAYFSGVKSALNCARSSECISGRDGSPSRPTYFSDFLRTHASENNSMHADGSDAPYADVTCTRIRRSFSIHLGTETDPSSVDTAV